MDIQELIDFKYEEIEGLKLNLSEDHYMNPEQEDELEELIAQAIKFGELCAQRDAKAQAIPDGFVLVERENLAMIFETATNALIYQEASPKHDALSIIQGIARKSMIKAQESK